MRTLKAKMTCLCNVAVTEVEKAKSTKFKISVSANLSTLVIWIRALLIFSVAVQWLKADGAVLAPRGLWESLLQVHVRWESPL